MNARKRCLWHNVAGRGLRNPPYPPLGKGGFCYDECVKPSPCRGRCPAGADEVKAAFGTMSNNGALANSTSSMCKLCLLVACPLRGEALFVGFICSPRTVPDTPLTPSTQNNTVAPSEIGRCHSFFTLQRSDLRTTWRRSLLLPCPRSVHCRQARRRRLCRWQRYSSLQCSACRWL